MFVFAFGKSIWFETKNSYNNLQLFILFSRFYKFLIFCLYFYPKIRPKYVVELVNYYC
jgi:hypothetical protein